MAWTSLCDLTELEEGKGKYVEIGGFQLGVFLDGGKVYVTDNLCPHAGGNLAGGHVEDGHVLCPWHSWPFNLVTGELREMPNCTISVYKTRLVQRSENPTLVQADLPIF